MTSHPIPTAALDDRLAFLGTSGAGKTFAALAQEERLLRSDARVIHIDPLGMAWGLRLMDDGETPSPFKIVIFGGKHGDLPLTENSGALIGDTVARMSESCILDFTEFKTAAAERRFMLAFLTALYRANTGLVHVVFDEADMWAPETILDREGDAHKLLGMMHTMVRRGRPRGFIPWLITQRPAVLSKSVLSMMLGLVVLQLTSSQDRDAIGNWVKGQSDKETWNKLWASLPEMAVGQGLVWIPRRRIMLPKVTFPKKATFDSSRAPERGETVHATALRPLNIDALRAKLSTVEQEVKANDPKELKAQIVALQRELAAKPQAAPVSDELVDQAHAEGFASGKAEGRRETAAEFEPLARDLDAAITKFAQVIDTTAQVFADVSSAGRDLTLKAKALGAGYQPEPLAKLPKVRAAPRISVGYDPRPVPVTSVPAAINRSQNGSGLHLGKGPQAILNSLAWWEVAGQHAPTLAQVGFVAGYRHTSGTFDDYRSKLKTGGLIEYPEPGLMRLTDDGRRQAVRPARQPSMPDFHDSVRRLLPGPLQKFFDALIARRTLTLEQLGEATGYRPTSGTFDDYRSKMKTLDLIEYPERGKVRIADWLYP